MKITRLVVSLAFAFLAAISCERTERCCHLGCPSLPQHRFKREEPSATSGVWFAYIHFGRV